MQDSPHLEQKSDGVDHMVPVEKMHPSARKLRDIYALTPGAPLLHREFGFYSLDEWKKQGMPEDVPLEELFQFDPPGRFDLQELGWTEAPFRPFFEERVIEDRGDHELVQDRSGRHVLFFKGRRSGFMPTYVTNPAKDWKTWEDNCKWRLDPSSPVRLEALAQKMEQAQAKAREGFLIGQRIIGGYMYLRSLFGPEELVYLFYDAPDLLHDCMQTWFALADAVIARHQQYVTLDELFLSEDICYNHGPLISPDMMKEFLIPYYQQLIGNIRMRQRDKSRRLHIQVDTDGFAVPVIPIYQDIGMDVMSPFEVASGCDVVEIGKQFPDLVILGGMDKRVLAESKADIDLMVERIIPPMRERGGYIPTCDHGVPAEVPYDNYLHYRRRCIELGA